MSWDTKIKKEITLKMFISIRVCWHSNLFLSSSVWGFPFTVFCRLFLFTVLLPCWCTVCHWLCLIMKIIYCISGFPSLCYMTWSVRTTNKFVYCSSCWLCFPLETCGSGAPPPGSASPSVSLNVDASVFHKWRWSVEKVVCSFAESLPASVDICTKDRRLHGCF